MPRPNFFIVGALKSGTTALCHYLSSHPSVFMPKLKEPRYFAEDFGDWRVVKSLPEYLRLFADASPGHRRIGEASPIYLCSGSAIGNIYRFSRSARLIVMLRNPVELVQSLHAQLLLTLDENEPNFRRAWALQYERGRGRSIPESCRAPALLQYRRIGNLGTQLNDVFRVFPPEQVATIVFDDFRSDTAREYRRILNFLSLDDDGRRSFPVVNPNAVNRWPGLVRALRDPPDWLLGPYRRLKNAVGFSGLGLLRRFIRLQERRSLRGPLDPDFRDELNRSFEGEIRLLSGLLDRDLSHWLVGAR